MTLFLEQYWIWLVAGLALLFSGGLLFQTYRRWKILFGLGGFGCVLLILGAVLVFVVPTDRKAVKATIYQLADSVENNDLNAVLGFLAPEAKKTRGNAQFYMRLAKLEKANVSDFKIVQMNYFTSPPSATVAFQGVVGGRAVLLDTKFTIIVKFREVELVKDESGEWLVTDQCSFDAPGYGIGEL